MNTLNKTLMGLGLLAIVSGGGTLNAANSQSNDELFDAIMQGNVDNAEQAIKNGADVNATNSVGWTPLHFATFANYKDASIYEKIVKLLIDEKADVNAKNKPGNTPLEIALRNSSLNFPATQISELLIKARADLNAQNKMGNTPLASLFGNDLVLILNSGVNASHKIVQHIKFLVENGADLLKTKNNQGLTPLAMVDPQNQILILESFFPLKKIVESDENDPTIKIEKANTVKPFLEAVLTVFAKQLSDKEESATLTKEQIEDLKKIDAPLTELEKETLISIVQKFIKLLYIGKEGFENELSKMKNPLGFSVKEILLYNKLFEKTSPLLNLLAEYSQGFSNYGKFYMKKNLQQITPKQGEKKPQLSDINILFQE